jgi:hypothetical protein
MLSAHCHGFLSRLPMANPRPSPGQGGSGSHVSVLGSTSCRPGNERQREVGRRRSRAGPR